MLGALRVIQISIAIGAVQGELRWKLAALVQRREANSAYSQV
jgi:hypothetical protein